jgi:hypothetical protein
MGPRVFLAEIVRPNVAELNSEFGDLRRAFNAIAAVDALAAHIFLWCRVHAPQEVAGIKIDAGYRDKLARENADFRLLRDAAKANKHVELTQGHPQVEHASQIKAEGRGWRSAVGGETRWGSPVQVYVSANPGPTRAADNLVNGALSFLESEMDRLGIP